MVTKKKKKKLSPTLTNIRCESPVEKYIKIYITLDFLCLFIFIANYDNKTHKIRICVRVICWVCFNVHKDLENHYKKLLLLLKPFHKSKIDLKKIDIFLERCIFE
jgi:hypothetical protein